MNGIALARDARESTRGQPRARLRAYASLAVQARHGGARGVHWPASEPLRQCSSEARSWSRGPELAMSADRSRKSRRIICPGR
eukprot:839537-Pyramimonas_sp.AAC.1